MGNLTVQQILADCLENILAERNFPLHQRKALRSLSVCRTQVLGGHVQYCENGHVNGVWYNSCRHRSCPQCQGFATERWLVKTEAMVLDCAHHHIVFTLPSELHDWWRYNRSVMTNILFRAVRETLKVFADDPAYLNARPGLLMALHTFGRSLNLHPHIHVLMSHGGLDGNGCWVEPKKKHLFPQKPVMMVFRGRFMALLKKAFEGDDWHCPVSETASARRDLVSTLYRKHWVVHFADRYRHGRGVVKYLSRYVKRSPLKNSQIERAESGYVRFRYKSHQTGRIERMRLSARAFVERLMEHVPTYRQSVVRYCGLYTSSARSRLNVAKEALGQQAPKDVAVATWSDYMEKLGHLPVCDRCGAALTHGEAVSVKKQ